MEPYVLYLQTKNRISLFFVILRVSLFFDMGECRDMEYIYKHFTMVVIIKKCIEHRNAYTLSRLPLRSVDLRPQINSNDIMDESEVFPINLVATNRRHPKLQP